MSKPLFSIVTPVYNNKSLVEYAIKSVLNQSVGDFEYIIIDDGSTDGTDKVLDDYQAIDSRITVIHQDNQWIYASMNRGVELANGKYIFILNSDDTIELQALEIASNILSKDEYDVIYTRPIMSQCDYNQNVLCYDSRNLLKYTIDDLDIQNRSDFAKEWMKIYTYEYSQSQANFYKAELIKSHPFRNDIYAADVLFNIEIAPLINKAYVLKTPIYNYFVYGNVNKSNTLQQHYSYEHLMRNEIYEAHLALLKKLKIDNDENIRIISEKRKYEFKNNLQFYIEQCLELDADEKLELFFMQFSDATMKKCFKLLGDENQLDARILNASLKVILDEGLDENNKMFFIYKMLESMLRYEKNEKDYKTIRDCLSHKFNPNHIGEEFYKILISSKESL